MDREAPSFIRVESLLSDILRERTGYDLADLDRDATFMELGFDSLFLIQLSQTIKQRFGVKVAFRQLIEEVTSIDKLLLHLVDRQVVPFSVPANDPQINTNSASRSAETPAGIPSPSHQPNELPAAPVATSPNNLIGAPTPSRATVSPDTTSQTGSLEQIIFQQNALMAQHLAILQGVSESILAEPANSPEAFAAPKRVHQPCSADGCDEEISTTHPSVAAPRAVEKHERFGPYKPIRRGANNGLTERQQEHLAQFIERFTRRTAKSRQLAESNRDHFADPRGVAGYRRVWKSMVYQIAVEKSKGSELWDIDGNRYIDIAMGFGLNLFGQSPDFVTQALHEQLDRGVELGPQSPIAGDVARLLCDFARKDRATFCSTGSEAVMAAMRLARTVTGKSKVVYFDKDYHGNFDQVLLRSTRIGNRQLSTPAAPGVSSAEDMIVLDYGSPQALQTIEKRAAEIAAVLIEPVQSADPFLQPKEFLQEIRRITLDNNMAMIMDEVISGFRAAQGGAQEWFDVWADMSTYGKILGGGMPIGALAGSNKYMDALDGGTWRYDNDSEPGADMTFFAGTFVRHPLALVAAHQVLMTLKEEGPELQHSLTAKTTRLVEALNRFFEREEYPIRLAQFASQFRFMFPPDLEYADMLYFHLLDRGIFTRGWADNCFLSTAHSDEDIEQVIKAVKESCQEIRLGGFFPEPVGVDTTSRMDLTFGGQTSQSTESSNTHASPRVQGGNARCVEPVGSMPKTASTLVEIQPKGDKTPIFCAPAADGFTRVYYELSNCLGDNQPVFGLDSPGIYGLPLPNTLEEMAADFIQEIRQAQPHGPYVVLGYCSGGTVALEIAQQLIASGEQVAMLGLIETYNWRTAPSTNPSWRTQIGYQAQRAYFHFRNFLLLNWEEKKRFFKSKLHAARLRTTVWRGSVARVFSRKGASRVIPRTVRMAELWRKHDDLAELYVPKPYAGRLIHFRPQQDYTCHLGPELEATEGVEYHRLKAYPAGMMVNPFVRDLAELIATSIAEGLAAIEERHERCAIEPSFANQVVGT